MANLDAAPGGADGAERGGHAGRRLRRHGVLRARRRHVSRRTRLLFDGRHRGHYNNGDAEKAKALLTKAKYDGKPMRILTSQQYDFHYKMALVMAENLKAAGFNVDLQVVDWATLTQRRNDPALWDIYITHSPFLPEPTLIAAAARRRAPGWWTSPTPRRPLDAFNAETDPQKRAALWANVQKVDLRRGALHQGRRFQRARRRSRRSSTGVVPAPWPLFLERVGREASRHCTPGSARRAAPLPSCNRGRRRMSRYVLQRFAGMLVVMFVVVTIVFFIVRLAPGDPAAVMLGPDATAAGHRGAARAPRARQAACRAVRAVPGPAARAAISASRSSSTGR